jgi:RND family efflux transporter MFP subunit
MIELHISFVRFCAVFFFALIGAACGDDHPHEEGGGHDHHEGAEGEDAHDHGEGTVGITIFSDSFEIFAEQSLAVAGEPFSLHTHVTALETFTAVTEGTVTLTLEGPEALSASATAPLRPGIFDITLEPTRAGEYRGRFAVSANGVEEELTGFTVTVHANDEAAGAVPHEEEGDAVAFLKEQQWRLPFGTTVATLRTLVPSVEVSGEVTTPPGGSAVMGAPIAGRVVVSGGGLPRPGDQVSIGQLLATLAPTPSSPEDAARASLVVAEAEARAASALSQVERAERLLVDRAIPERELELARREADVAAEAVSAARRAQSLYQSAASGRGAGTYRLTAPIAGVLTEVTAAPGTSVSAGDVLFRIVDPSELWIRARVPEHDAARVRTDGDASYRILGLDEWLPIPITGDAPRASVVALGRTVHRDSRTVDLIYALLDPDPRLRVGATVRVAVPAGEPSHTVAVPRSAVLSDEGRDVVYVQLSGESFDERAVRVGSRAGGWVAIESGVEGGERVVSRGANLVRLAARAATEPSHGHVH